MTTDEAFDYLCNPEGNLRVPCSRYGHDTESCAEVAVRVWEILLPELPEADPVELLDQVMGLVVNDHDDPEHTLRVHGTPEDHERFEVPIFAVVENTPGYLPESEPATFQTFAEAVEAARDLADEAAEALGSGDENVKPVCQTFVDGEYALYRVDTDSLPRVVEVSRIED